MASHKAHSGAPAKKPKFRLRWSVDRALVGSGVLVALGSLAFAGYVVSDRDWQPYFPGNEYLGIFSRPRRSLEAAASPSPVLASASEATDPNAVDPTPTGSIPDMTGLQSQERPLVAASLRVLAAASDHAWIGDGTSFRWIKVGDSLPGLGRVAAISQKNGQWTVLTDSGASIKSGDPSTPSQAANGPEKPFARSMIFGPGGE